MHFPIVCRMALRSTLAVLTKNTYIYMYYIYCKDMLTHFII